MGQDSKSHGIYGMDCLCPSGDFYMVSNIVKDGGEDSCSGLWHCAGGLIQGPCRETKGSWSHTGVVCKEEAGWTLTSWISIMSRLPQIVMAFTFQFNFFSFYKSLENASDKRMQQTTFRSLMSVLVVYLIVAFLGCVTFGTDVQGKILDNLNAQKEEFGSFFLILINFSFMFLSGLSFPMLFFNCRNFIVSVAMDIMNACNKKQTAVDETEFGDSDLKHGDESQVNQDDYDRTAAIQGRLEKNTGERDVAEATEDHPIGLEDEDEEDLTPAQLRERRTMNILFKSISVGLLVLLVVLAIWVNNFDAWLSWVAGIAATSIAFILPALFYIASTKSRHIWYKLAWVSFIIGVVTMCLNIFSNVYKITNPTGKD